MQRAQALQDPAKNETVKYSFMLRPTMTGAERGSFFFVFSSVGGTTT